MKKWLGLVLILAGAALLAIIAYLIIEPSRPDNAVSAQGPRLEVDQTTVDYGQVKFNTPIESVFTLRNVGDAPLKIEQTPEVELVEGC
ncbi:MAG: DUF1573 domain-containing protein [Caldilineales bacterium]|nr:DUF1573 domain-containing protein [Caldilineales bacterium]